MDSSKSPFDSSPFSGPGESAASESTSATGMFGKVTPQPSQPAEQDDLLQSLMRADAAPAKNATPEPPVEAQPTAAPQPAGAGSFTQMFQALSSSPPQPAKVENTPPVPAPPAPPKPAADLTSVFTPVAINKPAAPAPSPAPPAAPASSPKPGEFTQLLQTLNNPVLKTQLSPPITAETVLFRTPPESGFSPVHVPETSEPPPQAAPVQAFTPPPPAAAQPAGPGAFTQMFKTLSPETKPTAETVPAPAQPAPVAPPQPAAAGGFTQMFQALSGTKETAPAPAPVQPATTPQPPVAPPQSGPGSFTQMFSQIGAQNTPQEDPLASLKQQPPQPGSFQFSTPAPSVSPFGNPPPPAPAPSAQGGFTQLFQALGKDDAPSAKEPPPLMPSPPVAPTPPAAGGFTQLLRTLNAEPAAPPVQAAPPPMPAPAPHTPMPSSGPGEFTRIISGSMLREAQGQSAAPGSPPVMPPAGQSDGNQPGFQMPPPAFPKMPAAPATPQMHAGGAGGAPQMPHFQAPAFQFPQAPPAAAPQPPAPSKLQQYLPLILIVNVFVLIVVILIVIFALRHH